MCRPGNRTADQEKQRAWSAFSGVGVLLEDAMSEPDQLWGRGKEHHDRVVKVAEARLVPQLMVALSPVRTAI
ncbi:hypothetical protein [Streptomyces sp. NPDC050704]|uniref:hypothetical protein n=1 Tax=Streptomyces sp. NPDC050704 TaxID=3157219 RepID=UPI003445F9FC